MVQSNFLYYHHSSLQQNKELKYAVDAWIDDNDTTTNPNIGSWNTSEIEDMSNLFQDKATFNDDIGDWDTSKVENMEYMFYGCGSFNKTLNFDTSSVTNMNKMFFSCGIFNNLNQPLTFDTISVTNMKSMFLGCVDFVQEIRGWNVTSVIYPSPNNFENMFFGANAFQTLYNAPNTPTAAFFGPPVITITGFNPFYIQKGDTFTDDGATADGGESISTTITGPLGADFINTGIEGLYYITYSATKTGVGTTTKIRTVHVYIGQLGIPVCFPKGTPILTNLGDVAIEKLNPDQHTICDKEIVAITQTRPLQKHIVCFEKDSLSNNIPSQKTLCSKEHKISYQGEMTKARNLVDLCENVTFVSYNGETLYNVLLKQHDTMMINNMKCETLYPENIAAKISTMKDGQKKNKIVCELNKIIKENNIPEYQKLYASL